MQSREENKRNLVFIYRTRGRLQDYPVKVQRLFIQVATAAATARDPLIRVASPIYCRRLRACIIRGHTPAEKGRKLIVTAFAAGQRLYKGILYECHSSRAVV